MMSIQPTVQKLVTKLHLSKLHVETFHQTLQCHAIFRNLDLISSLHGCQKAILPASCTFLNQYVYIQSS